MNLSAVGVVDVAVVFAVVDAVVAVVDEAVAVVVVDWLKVFQGCTRAVWHSRVGNPFKRKVKIR